MKWRALRLHLLLVLAAVLVYGYGPFGEEYCYDGVIVLGPDSRIEKWADLGKVFSNDFGRLSGDLNFRPLAPLTFFIDSLVFQKSVFFSRLFNLVLHVLVGLSLFSLWKAILRRHTLPFAAALIFLIHPIASETVLCVGFRKDLLSMLLTVWTVRLIWECWVRRNRGYGFAAALVWLLALLAKEPAFMAIALAPLVLVYRRRLIAKDPEYARHRGLMTGEKRQERDQDRADASYGLAERWQRWIGRQLRFGWPIVATFVLLFGAWLFLYVQFRTVEGFDYAAYTAQAHRFNFMAEDALREWPQDYGPGLRFLNFTHTLLLYMRLWIYPMDLSINHFYPPVDHYGDLDLWFSLALFVLLLILSLRYYYRAEPAGLGAMWAFLCVAPICQVIPTPELVAERYVYPAHAGISLALAVALLKIGQNFVQLIPQQRVANPHFRWLRGNVNGRVFVLLALLVLGGITMARTLHWRNDLTLNLRAYELWDHPEGRMREGILLYAAGRKDEALDRLQEAVALQHDLADAWRVLGVIWLEKGQTGKAEDCFERAYRLEPLNPLNQNALELLDSEMQ
ncbi:MAG: tetratricopeptide repeat protein [Candidatus Sumerlaeia bacterium]